MQSTPARVQWGLRAMAMTVVIVCIILWFGLRSVEQGLGRMAVEMHRLDAELQRLDEAAEKPAPPAPRLRRVK